MTFSDHFKHSLKILGVMCVLLLGSYLWLKHKIHNIFVPPQVVLPRNDKEIVKYNENTHTITVTTAKGTTTQYSRNPNVEIRKDGTVKVDTYLWGTELRPILGVGYSDTGRAYTGYQLLYIRQFDFGPAIGWTADNRKAMFQPIVFGGWNFYSNTSLSVGMNPLTYILQQPPIVAVFLNVRL
jgi:hypothetical protein